MSTDNDLTRVAETIIAIESDGPYTEEEQESFKIAAEFFKDWATSAFEITREEREQKDLSEQDIQDAAQPLMAVAIELSRLAAGASTTIPESKLVERIRFFGKTAVDGIIESQTTAETEESADYDDYDSRGFY